MSDFRAIGGVSATLQALLTDRMELPDGLTSVPVTVGPPPFSSKDADPRREEPRVNLFLYRVTENGYLQNQDVAGRAGASGYGHPPLSLNLHYLLTAYGNKEIQANGSSFFDDTDAHFILGSAMRVLHDVPIVTDAVASRRPPSGVIVLHESLRVEYERVRLSLEPLSLEDVTKVWTALALRYRLSAAYLVNVVQIESRRTRTFPRPVGQPVSSSHAPLPSDAPSPGPWIHAVTIQTPTITEVRVRPLGQTEERSIPHAAIGDTLVLRGTSLAGTVTSVAFGDLEVPATLAGPTRVEAVIPDASVPGGGPIPAERQLQPGIRTVKVVARNPHVSQASFASNEAAFMLVPSVQPSQVTYSAGPPRSLTIAGSRLIGTSLGGETLIGRSTIPRSSYRSESPTQIVVPIPATLPARGVRLVVGGPLPDPVPIGGGPHALRIDIGGTVATRTRTLPPTLPLADVARVVEAMIHDATPAGAPPDARFSEARAVLWGGRLLVLPGDLTSPIAIDSPGGPGFAAALQLTVAQPPGAANAYVSGVLGSPPPLSAPMPRIQLKVGAAAAITIDVARATSLDALAADLEAKVNAFPQASYANAMVATTAGQLLVVPGAGGAVTFGSVPGDDVTVVELQLHADFSVRARVNGAESIDPAVVELPQ